MNKVTYLDKSKTNSKIDSKTVSILLLIQNAVLDKRLLKAHSRDVLTKLLTHYNRKTGLCFPSEKTLADSIGISEREVRRAIKLLKATEWIFVKRRFQDASLYSFNWTKAVAIDLRNKQTDRTHESGLDGQDRTPESGLRPDRMGLQTGQNGSADRTEWVIETGLMSPPNLWNEPIEKEPIEKNLISSSSTNPSDFSFMKESSDCMATHEDSDGIDSHKTHSEPDGGFYLNQDGTLSYKDADETYSHKPHREPSDSHEDSDEVSFHKDLVGSSDSHNNGDSFRTESNDTSFRTDDSFRIDSDDNSFRPDAGDDGEKRFEAALRIFQNAYPRPTANIEDLRNQFYKVTVECGNRGQDIIDAAVCFSEQNTTYISSPEEWLSQGGFLTQY